MRRIITGLSPSYALFWGKSPRKGSASHYPLAYHPLAYHCLDVAAVTQSLLSLVNGMSELLAEAFGVTDIRAVRNTVIFLAMIHDIGKHAITFQSLVPVICRKLGMQPVSPEHYSRRHGRGHDALGAWLWESERLAKLLLGVDDPDIAWFLGTGTFGHHGNPVNIDWLRDNERGHFSDPGKEAAIAFAKDCRELLGGRFAVPVDVPHAKKASFLIAAIVNAADWLASNEVFFPYKAPDQSLEEYWLTAENQAMRAVTASGLWSAPAQTKGGFHTLFPEMTPTPLQQVADSIKLPGQFLLVFEDSPGSGKTEASSTVASRALASGAARGLFFGLPTTATADAQVKRHAAFYRDLFGEHVTPPTLSLAHSVTKTGTVTHGRASCAAWIADDRRKRMLADVCVGTVDQALMAALPVKYAALRLFGLMGKLLVLDEVHSYDTYTARLIANLLRLHAALGGSAVLLSATMTARMKTDLAAAFQRGAGFEQADPAHLSHAAYPLVTLMGPDGSSIVKPQRAPQAPGDKKVILVHSKAQAERALLKCVRQGGCAVWIRNTVDAAVASGQKLRAMHQDTTIYHARFPEADRADIENHITQRYNKESQGAGRAGGLVVATAVIEQSLDIDFDLVVVDLKPMDAIIQGLGRGRRHARDRFGNPLPEGQVDQREPLEMIILSPDPDDVRSDAWYGYMLDHAEHVHKNPSVVWRTAAALKREGCVLYGDIRRLVEEAYDDAIPVPQCLSEATAKAMDDDRDKLAKGAEMAAGFTPEGGYDHIDGYWDDRRIPTRLGDSQEIVLVRMTPTGAIPYRGVDWSSGRMRIASRHVHDFDNDPYTPPQMAAARAACGFATLVPVDDDPPGVIHGGEVVDGFRCNSWSGLAWT